MIVEQKNEAGKYGWWGERVKMTAVQPANLLCWINNNQLMNDHHHFKEELLPIAREKTSLHCYNSLQPSNNPRLNYFHSRSCCCCAVVPCCNNIWNSALQLLANIHIKIVFYGWFFLDTCSCFFLFFSRPFKGVTHAPHRESRTTLFGIWTRKNLLWNFLSVVTYRLLPSCFSSRDDDWFRHNWKGKKK